MSDKYGVVLMIPGLFGWSSANAHVRFCTPGNSGVVLSQSMFGHQGDAGEAYSASDCTWEKIH